MRAFLRRPIRKWLQWLRGEAPPDLRGLYRRVRPPVAELIGTGACAFRCLHCIYPPDYARWNPSLPPEAWEGILRQLWVLGIRTFVYAGRQLDEGGVRLLEWLRRRFPGARIGLIDNGISLQPYLSALAEIRPDWVDISLDGMPEAHDRQRGQAGAWARALEGALRLKAMGVTPKVNILTCMTTINRASIPEMVRHVAALGFPNFFVTPVTVVEGLRPEGGLRVKGTDLVAFVGAMREALDAARDLWVELLLFDAGYMAEFLRAAGDSLRGWAPAGDHLRRSFRRGGSECVIRYYPSSLGGLREVIVNADGDVILPLSVAWGRIPSSARLGSLLRESPRAILERLPDSGAFQFFEDAFLEEGRLLRDFVQATEVRHGYPALRFLGSG